MEIRLFLILHLHNELFTIVIHTMNVVNDATAFVIFRQQFFIKEMNIANALFTHKQAVKEINNQILIDFLSKNAFETYIGKRIDKMCHNLKILFTQI